MIQCVGGSYLQTATPGYLHLIVPSSASWIEGGEPFYVCLGYSRYYVERNRAPLAFISSLCRPGVNTVKGSQVNVAIPLDTKPHPLRKHGKCSLLYIPPLRQKLQHPTSKAYTPAFM